MSKHSPRNQNFKVKHESQNFRAKHGEMSKI